jgi:hypothetical protein
MGVQPSLGETLATVVTIEETFDQIVTSPGAPNSDYETRDAIRTLNNEIAPVRVQFLLRNARYLSIERRSGHQLGRRQFVNFLCRG